MGYDQTYKQTNEQIFILEIFRYVMCKYMEYVLVNIELNYANSPPPPPLLFFHWSYEPHISSSSKIHFANPFQQ